MSERILDWHCMYIVNYSYIYSIYMYIIYSHFVFRCLSLKGEIVKCPNLGSAVANGALLSLQIEIH